MSAQTGLPGQRAALAVGAAIALSLILAPNFNPFADLSYYDSKRLLQIILCGAITLILLASLPLREVWLRRFLALPAAATWVLGAVLAGGVLSALAADWPEAGATYALAEVALFASVVLLAFSTASILGLYRQYANVAMLSVIAIAIGLYIFRFLSLYTVAVSVDDPVFVEALYANFSHMRFFGQWVSWTLPLIVIAPMLLPARRLRYLLYVMAGIWWTLLFVSGTRAGIAAIILAMIALPLLLGRPGRAWLRLQLISGVTGLAFYAAGFTLIETTHSQTGIGRLAALTTSGRPDIWHDAWVMIKAHPLLGAGPQSYAFELSHQAAHPHNSALQWAAEWGVLSFIAIFAVLSAGFVAWLIRARAQYSDRQDIESLVAAGLSASVLTAAAHSLFSGIIVMPLSQLYLGVVVGWMLFLYQQPLETQQRLPLNRHIALMLCAMLTFLCLLNIAVKDVPQLEQQSYAHRAEDGRFLRPRFWQHGRMPVIRYAVD